MARPSRSTATLRVACLALMLASCGGGGDEPLQIADAAGSSSYTTSERQAQSQSFEAPSILPHSTATPEPVSTDAAMAGFESRYRYDTAGYASAPEDSFSQQADVPIAPPYVSEDPGAAAATPN